MDNKKEAEPGRVVIALIISGILNGFLLSELLEGWQMWGALVLFILIILATLTATKEKEE